MSLANLFSQKIRVLSFFSDIYDKNNIYVILQFKKCVKQKAQAQVKQSVFDELQQ